MAAVEGSTFKCVLLIYSVQYVNTNLSVLAKLFELICIRYEFVCNKFPKKMALELVPADT